MGEATAVKCVLCNLSGWEAMWAELRRVDQGGKGGRGKGEREQVAERHWLFLCSPRELLPRAKLKTTGEKKKSFLCVS